MRNSNKDKTLEESIIDLYLGLKLRRTEEKNQNEEDREKLRKTNPKIVLEYVKSSIDILISTTVREKLERISANNSDIINLDETEVNEYEKQLRQVESEIRNHIRVSFYDIQIQHQMKLFTEVQQSKIEELEKHNDELKKRFKEANEVYLVLIKKLGKCRVSNPGDSNEKRELELLRNENISLKNILKSYEERNLNISDLEKKIRLQHSKHKNELKSMEEQYLEKIKKYKRKIKQYEEIFKNASIKDFKTDIPNTERSNKIYNRCGSMTDRQKKSDDITGKIGHYKINIDKRFNDINNINFTIEELNQTTDINENRKDRNIKTNISNNNLTTNIRSENFETLNIETNPLTQRKKEKSKEKNSSKLSKPHHIRTNSIAGSKPVLNNCPTFHLNLNNIKQKAKDNMSFQNNIKANKSQLQHQKSKDQLANIINIYTSNMNNIKTKEINVKQFVNTNKTQKMIKDTNSNTARNYSNNNKNQ